MKFRVVNPEPSILNITLKTIYRMRLSIKQNIIYIKVISEVFLSFVLCLLSSVSFLVQNDLRDIEVRKSEFYFWVKREHSDRDRKFWSAVNSEQDQTRLTHLSINLRYLTFHFHCDAIHLKLARKRLFAESRKFNRKWNH